ncbi:MAG: 50S ribosomal protein L18 [Endomicrobium sp.]|jgi:large subunit ribosomal protein L18|nr:50S ribosomal protein L18 [Endomicrobium sp.]
MKDSNKKFNYRVKRVRSKIEGTNDRPRLSVRRGHKHIYAQIIDDSKGTTIVSASTLSPELKGKLDVTDTVSAAKNVGGLIAKKATEKGVKKIVFDRRGYKYTGKIKALADAAREQGLEF